LTLDVSMHTVTGQKYIIASEKVDSEQERGSSRIHVYIVKASDEKLMINIKYVEYHSSLILQRFMYTDYLQKDK